MINTKEAIKSISLFSHLGDEELELIASMSDISSYNSDTILFYETETTDRLLFLVDGLLKVYKIDKYDNEIFLYYVYPNSMISELSNLNDNRINCFSNSEFLRDSLLLSIDFTRFKQEFLVENELVLKFINELIYKNQQLQCIVNRELVFDATSKVAFMLTNDLVMFNQLKRNEVALLLHIQPETLSRVLKRLVRTGTLSIDKGHVEILKPEELKSIYLGYKMKKIGVSQKIKILGSLLLGSIFCVIFITIYLNQKNIKDATIVNIAGKQRMLTQRITKNVFYLYQVRTNNFVEIDNAIDEFNYGLKTLRDGNHLLKISEAPTEKISEQLAKVTVLWTSFEKNVNEFKHALLTNDIQKLNSILSYVYQANNTLLKEVDMVVTLYTDYIEHKTAFIKNFQYIAFSFLFLFALYSLIQLKQIETHAKEFMEKYKDIGSSDFNELEPIYVESEKEFVEMADNLNCFINKVNSAMGYSQTALEQSRMASEKLQDLADEFEDIISEIGDKSDIMKGIDRSEDIAIESSENLLRTTKKLNDLKKQLDLLLKNCEKVEV